MTLDQWCSQRNLSHADLARLLGVRSRMTACRYRRGDQMPRPAIMARIVHVTGGAVTEADMYRAHVAYTQAAA
jgi:transcriptional regulator with XRE-family HTH domain